MIKKLLFKYLFNTGKYKGLYLRVFKPGNQEYAEYLKVNGKLISIGNDCEINTDVSILDPYLVRLGNNVSLSSCTLVGHDGSISVLNKAFNKKLDSVGPIDIKDNVFIGIGAIVLPNVTIGPTAIVAAGSVVTKDVEEGSIVAGVPARKIGTVSDYVEKLEMRQKKYPWNDIIQKREGGFDPKLEPILQDLRKKYFWGKSK